MSCSTFASWCLGRTRRARREQRTADCRDTETVVCINDSEEGKEDKHRTTDDDISAVLPVVLASEWGQSPNSAEIVCLSLYVQVTTSMH